MNTTIYCVNVCSHVCRIYTLNIQALSMLLDGQLGKTLESSSEVKSKAALNTGCTVICLVHREGREKERVLCSSLGSRMGSLLLARPLPFALQRLPFASQLSQASHLLFKVFMFVSAQREGEIRDLFCKGWKRPRYVVC